MRGRPLSSTSIYIEWNPPPIEDQNGDIISYTVLCFAVNGGAVLLSYTTATTDITISGLHPYYTYKCNVSAVTVAEGPSSGYVNITTLEDGMFFLTLMLTSLLLKMVACFLGQNS